MENLEADDQETSTFKTISISVGIGCNYNEKGSEKLSCNMVSPYPGLFGRSAFAEAKKRLKKLERDYQHACQKYTELQSDRYRYHKRHSGHDIDRAGSYIRHIKNVVQQLQNFLANLNTEGAPQRRRETSSKGKQFFLKHGCKSLTQEMMILQLKVENKEQYSDDLSHESIDVKRIHEELSYIQRMIPESSSKKPLLRRVKDIKKLMEKTISNGELVGNLTSHQDNMKNCTSIKVKLLTKAIRDFEKETEERENILQEKRRIGKGYPEKMRVLKEKCDCIGEKRDAEKTNMLDLKKNFRSRHKNASQRHC